MNGRAGFYKNNLSGEMAYKSFVPSKLPPNPEIEIDAEIISLLTKANANIATLETVSNRIPNKILYSKLMTPELLEFRRFLPEKFFL